MPQKPSKRLLESLDELRGQGVQFAPVDSLKPWADNPNVHEPGVPTLLRIIQRFGWTEPIIVRRADREIAAGHGRLTAAAQELGLSEVPVIYRDFTAHESHAYALADNRAAELSHNNEDVLARVMQELIADSSIEDVLDTGFGQVDIERILKQLESEPPPPEEPTQQLDPSDVRVTIGRYRFTVPRAEWARWEDELRATVSFEGKVIVAELQRRLGFT